MIKLHLKAIRAYLGVPKNSCNVGVLSEVDWLLPEYRTRIRMIRQYSRMLNMEDSRLTKRIMLWDRRLNSSGTVSSWSNEIKLILDQCNLSSVYSSNHSFHLKTVIESISNKFKQDQCNFLRTECAKMPKLRTFMLFKEFGATAPHLTKPLNFFQRKTLSKLRLGSLELRIDLGRYQRPALKIHERNCLACSKDSLVKPVETEYHFLFGCKANDFLRREWFQKMTLPENFQYLPDHRKLDLLLNKPENVKSCAQFVINMLSVRNPA